MKELNNVFYGEDNKKMSREIIIRNSEKNSFFEKDIIKKLLEENDIFYNIIDDESDNIIFNNMSLFVESIQLNEIKTMTENGSNIIIRSFYRMGSEVYILGLYTTPDRLIAMNDLLNNHKRNSKRKKIATYYKKYNTDITIKK